MYQIVFSKEADKALRRMPRQLALTIAGKIEELAGDPYAMRQVKKLTNHPGYRLRVGDWRVVYTLNDQALLIHVIKVRPRGEVYR